MDPNSPGSQLTIQPGEWVIARMNFKIESRYLAPLKENRDCLLNGNKLQEPGLAVNAG